MRASLAMRGAVAVLLAGNASAFAPLPAAGVAARQRLNSCTSRSLCQQRRIRSTSLTAHLPGQEHEQDCDNTLSTAPSSSSSSSTLTNALALILATTTLAPPAAWAEAPEWLAPTRGALDPLLLYLEFAFLCRIVLSWYPNIDLNKVPQNLVAWPTEPLLKPTRAVVPPAFGVDISPIVWVMLLSFVREVLFGQQGIFNMLAQQ
jgi:YggT family protein